MLLMDKNAVIYGSGGAVGRAVARAFAREGARVFLTGRTKSKVHAAAEAIAAEGGAVDVASVDALDEQAVEAHLAKVVETVGRVDVSFNAVGIDNGEQGLALCDLSAEAYCRPIQDYTRTNFITATAAARRMVKQGAGVLLPLSIPLVRAPEALGGPFGQAFAAVENLARQLAVELGPSGVRVVGLRPTGMPETARSLGSHVRAIWSRATERMRVPLDGLLDEMGAATALKRPLGVDELAEVAAFMASDRASGITGTVINVSCGGIGD